MTDDNPSTPPAPTKVEELPDWAQTLIRDLRAESANRRVELTNRTTELTTASNALAAVGTEKDTFKAQADKAATDLLRLNVALAAGIPGDKAAVFAARLQGSNEDELKHDAEALKGAFGSGSAPPPATDPSQGQGGTKSTGTPEGDMALFLRSAFEDILN